MTYLQKKQCRTTNGTHRVLFYNEYWETYKIVCDTQSTYIINKPNKNQIKTGCINF